MDIKFSNSIETGIDTLWPRVGEYQFYRRRRTTHAQDSSCLPPSPRIDLSRVDKCLSNVLFGEKNRSLGEADFSNSNKIEIRIATL